MSGVPCRFVSAANSLISPGSHRYDAHWLPLEVKIWMASPRLASARSKALTSPPATLSCAPSLMESRSESVDDLDPQTACP